VGREGGRYRGKIEVRRARGGKGEGSREDK
jgi:hypothetical protein